MTKKRGVEENQSRLDTRTMAKMMLKFFGPNGERWRNHGLSGSPRVGCCLVQATDYLFSTENELVFDKIIVTKLGLEMGTISLWNDAQQWPAVQQLLKAIRDRRPFRKAA